VAKNILHMLSSLKHMSPFDVNMALDAGFDSVTPYKGVTLDEIAPLVQDAMFSRSPRDAARTCVFFAGKDAGLALDMMEALKATLLKPFEISSFADPAGSLTTAAAMVACVEKILKKKKGRAFAKTKIMIFGATGVVGYASGVIAALEGADVTLAGYDGLARVQAKANDIKRRFGVDVRAVNASTPEKLLEGWLAPRSCFALRPRASKSCRHRRSPRLNRSSSRLTSMRYRRRGLRVSISRTMASNCRAAFSESGHSPSAM
jgi:methylene-tetrahydromethanopterin dehydrogenase